MYAGMLLRFVEYRWEGKERDLGMVVNQKSASASKSLPVRLALGWCVAVLATLAGALTLSALILSGRTGWGTIGYGAMVVLLLASYLGSACSCKFATGRGLLSCGLFAMIYFFTLVSITVLFFGSQFGTVWLLAILVAGGAAAAMLIHCAPKQNGVRKKKRRRLK